VARRIGNGSPRSKLIERFGVDDLTCIELHERTRHEFQTHKRLARSERVGEVPDHRVGEPEPRVVGWVADHDYGFIARLATRFKSSFNQLRPDALTLPRRRNGHRRQRSDVNTAAGRNDRCTREHDVPYDPIRRRDRYERGNYIAAASQQIHKPRLVVTAESTAVHLRHAGVVLGSLGTDAHTPMIWRFAVDGLR
jgi:hypothetical protein